MNNTKKYYWLKLQNDFFKRNDIRVVEAMPNGKDYIIFYLKLLCESIVNDGVLRFSEEIPYSDEMLSTITSTNIDVVRSAINVFKELKMIEIYDDGTLFMKQVEKMVGSETKWANYKRVSRNQNKEIGQCPTNVQKQIGNCPIEIEKDKDIDIEKDIDIDTDINKDINKDIENKIIDSLSSSKDIFISIKMENEYEKTLMMMIKAAQVTKIIPTQGRLEDLMKEMIFDRQDVSNKQGYLIECFRNEREQCKTMYTN